MKVGVDGWRLIWPRPAILSLSLIYSPNRISGIQEKVVIKECKRILSFNTSSKSIARFTVNDISWNVCLANRCHRDQDLDASLDADEEDIPWPGNIMIYVTMDGRDQLRNYELAIEQASDEDGDVMVDDDDDDEDDDDGDDATDNRPPPVRCVIVRRDTFKRGEKLYFPIDDPHDWVFGKELELVFMVRPLTYQQKCIDQEIYFKKLLSEERAKNAANTRGREAPSGTQESFGIPGSSSSSSSSSSIKIDSRKMVNPADSLPPKKRKADAGAKGSGVKKTAIATTSETPAKTEPEKSRTIRRRLEMP